MGRLEGADGAVGHVSSRLDDYLLGTLSQAEEFVVEAHLLCCSHCRAECDVLGNAAFMMATLAPEIVASMEEVTPSASGRESVGHRRHRRRARAASPRSRPGDQRSADTSSPSTAPRRRALRLAVAFAAVLVLGAVLGAGGLVLAAPGTLQDVPVGSDTQDGTAGRLSVTVADRAGGGIDVRAMAVGLQAGMDYELVAIADNGRNYVAARGVAVGGPQTILGVVPLAASGVRFLAIVQPNGGSLLVARPTVTPGDRPT